MESPPPSSPAVALNMAEIRARQNFPLAVFAGFGAVLAGAVLWGVVTAVTHSQLGIVAIAVGVLVGYTIRYVGKGFEPKFGYLGAFYGLLGCGLGNLLSYFMAYAQHLNIPVTQLLTTADADLVTHMFTRFFQPMDLLFYAIAIYEAYKFSFRYRLTRKAPASRPPA